MTCRRTRIRRVNDRLSKDGGRSGQRLAGTAQGRDTPAIFSS